MVYLTCIKLSVILRLARKIHYYKACHFMKMIYRSDMSKIYADASYNRHFSSYHTERKIKTPGLTSRYFRSTAHGTQTTNQRSKRIMMITFFTHLDGERAHLQTRHLNQNRLTLPLFLTYQGFKCSIAKLGRAIPNSHRNDAPPRTVHRESDNPAATAANAKPDLKTEKDNATPINLTAQ